MASLSRFPRILSTLFISQNGRHSQVQLVLSAADRVPRLIQNDHVEDSALLVDHEERPMVVHVVFVETSAFASEAYTHCKDTYFLSLWSFFLFFEKEEDRERSERDGGNNVD